MIIAYASLLFSILCLIFVLVLLIKFKKLFSQDAILKKIDIYMNKRVKELDSIANRDIELNQNAQKNLRALIQRSDEEIEKFKEATDRLRNMIAESQKYSDSSLNSPNLNIVSTEIMTGQTYSDFAPDSKYNTLQNTNNTYHFNKPVVVTDDITPASKNFIRLPKKIEKKNFSKNVKALYELGYSISEICQELSCSETEVQYVIDLGL